MHKTRTALLAALALLAVGTARAAGDAEAGKARAAMCAACHGPAGVAINDMYPDLAGQNEKYLVDAIKQYRDGRRDNPMMKPMVASLGDADAANLAAFYAAQPCA